MDRGRHCALLRGVIPCGAWLVVWLVGFTQLQAQPQPSPSVVPSVAVPPAASPTPSPAVDEVRKRMVQEHQREQAATEEEKQRRATEKALLERRKLDLSVSEEEAQRRINQLPPEEREAFKRNLKLWRELSPEERQTVRQEADARMRAEIEKAEHQTGLRLDKDQEEVFALRYKQERRKLERDLQEKLEAERARRLPLMIDALRREFADKALLPTSAPTAAGSPSASAKPTPTTSATTAAKPAVTPAASAKPAMSSPSVSVPAP